MEKNPEEIIVGDYIKVHGMQAGNYLSEIAEVTHVQNCRDQISYIGIRPRLKRLDENYCLKQDCTKLKITEEEKKELIKEKLKNEITTSLIDSAPEKYNPDTNYGYKFK